MFKNLTARFDLAWGGSAAGGLGQAVGAALKAKLLFRSAAPPLYGGRNQEEHAAFVAELKAAGDEFTDAEFPAQRSSLIADWDDPSEDVRAIVDDWSTIEWLRASQIPCLNAGGK